MLSFLAKRWFVLLLVLGVTVAWLRPEWVRPWVERIWPQAVVFASLLLVALSLESRSLFRTLVRPWAALWALAMSYGALPLLAWGLGTFLPLADLRVGLLIIASVPCTLASAVLWTRLGGGNEAVALLVVVLSTSTSWLITTFWLTLTTRAQVDLNPGDLMQELVFWLIVPVGLGQLSRAIPGVANGVRRYRTVLGVIGRLLIFSIIIKAAVGLSEHTAGLTLGVVLATALICVGAHLAVLALGLWSSRGLRLAWADGIAVAIAGSQKTLQVALVLFYGYYEYAYPLAVVPLVFYHVGQLFVDTFIADWLANRPARIAQEKSFLQEPTP
jgi:sodium/bile acid cotransporter 7